MELGVATDTSKQFLEGAKDRERRVRLAANEGVLRLAVER